VGDDQDYDSNRGGKGMQEGGGEDGRVYSFQKKGENFPRNERSKRRIGEKGEPPKTGWKIDAKGRGTKKTGRGRQVAEGFQSPNQ